MAVNVFRNQSIVDLTIQTYGNASSLAQAVRDNIRGDFEFSSALTPGFLFQFDIENGSANKRVLKRLKGQHVMRYRVGIINTNIITEDGFDLITEDGQLIIKE